MFARRVLFFAALISALVAGFTGQVQAQESSTPAAAPDFNSQVLPILQQYCLGCHSANEPEHDLVLESYEGILSGGQSGAVLLPGQADNSRLLLVVDGRAEPRMPPEGNESPTAEEIALLKAWVAAGAPGPSGAPPDPTLLVTPHVPLLSTPRQSLQAAALSPDGQIAALAGYRTVSLLAVGNRARIRSFDDLRGSVTSVAFSADGQLLLTAAGEPGLFGEARLYRVNDGSLVQRFVGHKDSLYAAALSPDGLTLATGGYDQQIKLWDVASGQEKLTISGHNGAVFDLAFSPDGRWLASASADRTVKLWEVATGQRLETFGQPLKEQYSVAFSPDGRRLAGAGADNRIRVWQLSETGQEGTNPLLVTRYAHEGAILNLCWSRDANLLVTTGEDRFVKVWDAGAVSELRALPQSDWAPAIALGDDNKTLIVGRLDGTATLYDAQSGEILPPPAPTLATATPQGVQAGSRVRVQLNGQNLLGASGLLLDGAPLADVVFHYDPARADFAEAEATLPTGLSRGKHALSLQTAGGLSNSLELFVDDVMQLAEVEPNGTPEQAQLLALPAAAWGVIAARGDQDHFACDLQPGQTLVMELQASSLASKLNGVLTVLDPQGMVVAANNDFGAGADPLLAYTAVVAGRHVVRVDDQTLTGSAEHTYRLTLGTFAYVSGVYPLAVSASAEQTVELAGYNLPPGAAITLPASSPGEQQIPLDPALYRARDGLKVLVVDGPAPREQEPNDAPAEATLITVPATLEGRIERAGDVDLFRFDARAGESWAIEVDASRRGSPLDSHLAVLDAEGRSVPRLLLQATLDSYVTFRPVDSNAQGLRPRNWEEMDLNQYMYLQGEVVKTFRMPQGPDSEMVFYALGGRRRCYFDTSATAHPLDEPCYIVQPYAPGTSLAPNGLPIFTLNYENDDDAERKLGSDSKLIFTAPSDGTYLVRVTDVRQFGGDRFAYRLSVRRPQPGFTVRLADANPTVNRGSGRRLTFAAERHDDFDGPIRIEVSNLPVGFAVSGPTVIEAGHVEARAVLTAALDAVAPPGESWSQVRIQAVSQVAGQDVVQELGNLGTVTLGEPPPVRVTLEPAELTIAPGTTITALLRIERNGNDDFVNFTVDNLPHGVIVDNIGLNGVQIRPGETERQIFLTASRVTPPSTRQIHAVADNAGGEASPAIVLHVCAEESVAAGN